MEKTLEQLQQENTYLKQENEILKDILRKRYTDNLVIWHK